MNSATEKTINQLFAITGEDVFSYEVPIYQREYSWKKPHQDEFFNDIQDNAESYFLGLMVHIEGGDKIYQIIDGQQRLLATSLLLIAVHEKMDTLLSKLEKLITDNSLPHSSQSDDAIARIRTAKTEIESRLILKGDDGKDLRQRLTPSRQNKNKEDYLCLLGEKIPPKGSLTFPSRAANPHMGNRSIAKRFKHFSDLLEKLCASQQAKDFEEIKTAGQKILNFLTKLLTAKLIVFTARDSQKVHVLFKALNDRGLPLSAIDLIKNVVFQYLQEAQHEDAANRWQQILDNLGEKIGVLERFFRQHFMVCYETRRFLEKSKLISEYEIKIKGGEPTEILNEIVESSSLYKDIIAEEKGEKISDSLYSELCFLRQIEAGPSYFLLLYLFKRFNSGGDDWNQKCEDVEKVVQILCRFFLFRHLTNTPDRNELDSIFFDLVRKLRDRQDVEIVSCVREHLMDKVPSLATFGDEIRKKISEPLYDENESLTRFVLFYLEFMAQNVGKPRKSMNTEWLKRMEDTKKWSIEHVLPQGRNWTPAWQEEITSGEAQDPEEIRDNYLHCLGNLTLTAYNSELKDKSFAAKKNLQDKDNNYIGYRESEIWLHESIRRHDKWTPEIIQARTKELTEKFLELFNLDNI